MVILEENFIRADEVSFPAISIKFPWYNSDHKIIGAFGFSIVIGTHSLADSLMLVAKTGLLAWKSNTFTSNQILPGGEINGIYLSKRELDCLHPLIRGKTAKEIGKILNLSPRTVESYLENIKSKLSVDSKAELIDLIINKIFS